MNLNKLPYYPNILLISGNGRNVGKTTLSCAVIEHFKEDKIIGVKIAPHFHKYDPIFEDVKFQTDDFVIIEEHHKNTGKDSAKMLSAGALRVFYIMVKDFSLQEAFNKLIEYTGMDYPMIIESAALRNIIKPSVFLLIKHIDRQKPKQSINHLMKKVDREITLSSIGHDFAPTNLDYIDKTWVLI